MLEVERYKMRLSATATAMVHWISTNDSDETLKEWCEDQGISTIARDKAIDELLVAGLIAPHPSSVH